VFYPPPKETARLEEKEEKKWKKRKSAKS